MEGGCGCEKKMTGGNGYSLPLINTHENDPLAPNRITSVRMNGGGRRSRKSKKGSRKSKKRSRKSKKRSRKHAVHFYPKKIKGGSNFMSPDYTNSVAYTTGSLIGSVYGSNVVLGNIDTPDYSSFNSKPFI